MRSCVSGILFFAALISSFLCTFQYSPSLSPSLGTAVKLPQAVMLPEGFLVSYNPQEDLCLAPFLFKKSPKPKSGYIKNL